VRVIETLYPDRDSYRITFEFLEGQTGEQYQQ